MLTRAIVPRRLDRSGVTMGVTAGVEQNGTQTEGGVYQKQRGGCPTPPVVFSLSLFVVFVLARRCRTAPAERERTGATPPFCRWRGTATWGVWHQVYHLVYHTIPAVGGVAPV